MKALRHEMPQTPNQFNTKPIVPNQPNVATFLMMREKAFQAALQNQSLVRATWMYAFFVINFMHFSSNHNK